MTTTYHDIGERRLSGVGNSSAAIEVFGGLAVVILTILGLIGVAPEFLLAIAGIVFGVSVLAQGSAIATEYSALFSRMGGGTVSAAEFGNGMSVEVLAGGATIVLGILALVGEAPPVLLSALVIVGGVSVLVMAAAAERLNTVKMESAESAERIMTASASGAASGQFLGGVAAIVLGIIALNAMASAGAPGAATGAQPTQSWLILTLVGLLVLGASMLMSGGSLMAQLSQLYHRAGIQR